MADLRNTVESMKNAAATYSINMVNDESADMRLENLMNDVESLKTKNDKLEKEIVSVRQGVDHWKDGVNKMSA